MEPWGDQVTHGQTARVKERQNTHQVLLTSNLLTSGCFCEHDPLSIKQRQQMTHPRLEEVSYLQDSVDQFGNERQGHWCGMSGI